MRFGFGKRGLIQLHRQETAAALLRAVIVTRVRQKVFQGAEEKRTEPSFLSIRARVGTGLDEVSEKALGQILRIVRPISLSA